jgi:hypothetical protein
MLARVQARAHAGVDFRRSGRSSYLDRSAAEPVIHASRVRRSAVVFSPAKTGPCSSVGSRASVPLGAKGNKRTLHVGLFICAHGKVARRGQVFNLQSFAIRAPAGGEEQPAKLGWRDATMIGARQ